MCINIFLPSFAMQEGSESKKRPHIPDSNEPNNKRFRSDPPESRVAAEKGLVQWLIDLENPDSIPACIECASKGHIDATGALLLKGGKLLNLKNKKIVLDFCCIAARNNEDVKEQLIQFTNKVVSKLENAVPQQKNLAHFYAGILYTFDVVWPKNLNQAIAFLIHSQDTEAQDIIKKINESALKNITMLMAISPEIWSDIFRHAFVPSHQMRLVCKGFCDIIDLRVVKLKVREFNEIVASKCNSLINLQKLVVNFQSCNKNSLASRNRFEATNLWENFLKKNQNISMLTLSFPNAEDIFSQLTCDKLAKGLKDNKNLQCLTLQNCNVYALKDIAEGLKDNAGLHSLEVLHTHVDHHVDIKIKKFADNAARKQAYDNFGLFINFTSINDKIFLLFHIKVKKDGNYNYLMDAHHALPLTPDSTIGRAQNGRLILRCESPTYTEEDIEGTYFHTYEAGIDLADLKAAGINVEHFTQLLDKPEISLSLVHPLMKLFDHHHENSALQIEHRDALDSMIYATIIFSENMSDNGTFKNLIVGREEMLKGFRDDYYTYNDEYILQFFGYNQEVIEKYMNAIQKLSSLGITVK